MDNNNFSNLIQKVAEHQKRVNNFSRVYANIASAVGESIHSISKAVGQWVKLMQERELTLDELSEFLSDLNYPPIDMNISVYLLKDLNNELTQADDFNAKLEVLDQFIVQFFDDEQLEYKMEMWEEMECLDGRLHIIKEIVEAHKIGLYSLSTLAVFPQIEGVLAETFPELRNKNGQFNRVNQWKALESVLDLKIDRFDSVWSSYYENNILNGFKHLEPIESLSRHALAHGADKDYGTVVNSTKSLMILDYIMTKIEYYKIDKEFENK